MDKSAFRVQRLSARSLLSGVLQREEKDLSSPDCDADDPFVQEAKSLLSTRQQEVRRWPSSGRTSKSNEPVEETPGPRVFHWEYDAGKDSTARIKEVNLDPASKNEKVRQCPCVFGS